MNTADIIADLTAAMRQRGLIPPNDLASAASPLRSRRCAPWQKRRHLPIHLDKYPGGSILNWKDGMGWQDWRYSNGNGSARMDGGRTRGVR